MLMYSRPLRSFLSVAIFKSQRLLHKPARVGILKSCLSWERRSTGCTLGAGPRINRCAGEEPTTFDVYLALESLDTADVTRSGYRSQLLCTRTSFSTILRLSVLYKYSLIVSLSMRRRRALSESLDMMQTARPRNKTNTVLIFRHGRLGSFLQSCIENCEPKRLNDSFLVEPRCSSPLHQPRIKDITTWLSLGAMRVA
ncbi:hypothetical protein BJ508DRAFT_178452 [Ascobolus immersus RN42]|uniref:Uncharacterized protein n=1 Tax=Ascobolus immersus RN42 TaxID=1160509 RepID=A0A3N4IJH4_ASCIM|nr:hypothetical protein BJ508DRAFT_178452 [Ascobolus immersus RN42]